MSERPNELVKLLYQPSLSESRRRRTRTAGKMSEVTSKLDQGDDDNEEDLDSEFLNVDEDDQPLLPGDRELPRRPQRSTRWYGLWHYHIFERRCS